MPVASFFSFSHKMFLAPSEKMKGICAPVKLLPANALNFCAFADHKNKCDLKFDICNSILKTMGKGQNADYQHFVLSLLFSKCYFSRVLKPWIM